MRPFPVYPGLQMQLNPSGASSHLAFISQLSMFKAHSSTSEGGEEVHHCLYTHHTSNLLCITQPLGGTVKSCYNQEHVIICVSKFHVSLCAPVMIYSPITTMIPCTERSYRPRINYQLHNLALAKHVKMQLVFPTVKPTSHEWGIAPI